MPSKRTPQIVVVDGRTMNPGDNPWTPLESLGELSVYDNTPADLLIERIGDATVVVNNKSVFSRDVLSQLPNLKLIAMTATGYDVVDIESARELDVRVANVPAYSTRSVAQHVFAMLLSHINQPRQHDIAVRAGRWQEAGEFSFWLQPLTELAGKTMGIVGLGRIGTATAEVAAALGMQVIASSRTEKEPLDLPGFRWVDLETLFRESDVVSLHCPLTDENQRFVNAALLKSMKSTAILINTARGGLIDEADLAAALDAGRPAFALLDVVSQEPITSDNPLLTTKNCLLTPHIAWATIEARRRAMMITAENIAGFLNGQPVNLVN